MIFLEKVRDDRHDIEAVEMYGVGELCTAIGLQAKLERDGWTVTLWQGKRIRQTESEERSNG